MTAKKLTKVQEDTINALKVEFKGSNLVYLTCMNGYRPSITTMNALVKKGFLCVEYTEKIPYEFKSDSYTQTRYESRIFYKFT